MFTFCSQFLILSSQLEPTLHGFQSRTVELQRLVVFIHWLRAEDFIDMKVPVEGLELETLVEESFALLTNLSSSIQSCRKGLVDHRLRHEQPESGLFTQDDLKSM